MAKQKEGGRGAGKPAGGTATVKKLRVPRGTARARRRAAKGWSALALAHHQKKVDMARQRAAAGATAMMVAFAQAR